MRIVHLCLQAPYNDYWGYQDNLLPKYQCKQGHEVTVITTNTKHQDGKIINTGVGDYYLDYGQRIIRLDYIRYNPQKISNVYKIYKIYNLLCELKPDFIMVHGLGNFSVLQVVKYKRRINPKCRIIADNHLDYNNCKLNHSLKSNIYMSTVRLLNIFMQKYYEKVYGVTPWREKFCQEVFKISPSRTDVLIMGADDEKIKFERKDEIKNEIRNKYGICDNELLIVTGGKIDKKKNIELLIDAVQNISNIKLLIFGNINHDMQKVFERYYSNEKTIFIGWINSDSVYDYFLAADLAVFPGGHSVLWEQACACKIPCIFKHWEGLDHLDLGGNCLFINKNDKQELQKLIETVVNDNELYQHMLKVSTSYKSEKFFYSRIAKECLQNRND